MNYLLAEFLAGPIVPRILSTILLGAVIGGTLFANERISPYAGMAGFLFIVGAYIYGSSCIGYVLFSRFPVMAGIHCVVVLLVAIACVLAHRENGTLWGTIFWGVFFVAGVTLTSVASSSFLAIGNSIIPKIALIGMAGWFAFLSQELVIENGTLAVFRYLPAKISYAWLERNHDLSGFYSLSGYQDAEKLVRLAVMANNTELAERMAERFLAESDYILVNAFRGDVPKLVITARKNRNSKIAEYLVGKAKEREWTAALTEISESEGLSDPSDGY